MVQWAKQFVFRDVVFAKTRAICSGADVAQCTWPHFCHFGPRPCPRHGPAWLIKTVFGRPWPIQKMSQTSAEFFGRGWWKRLSQSSRSWLKSLSQKSYRSICFCLANLVFFLLLRSLSSSSLITKLLREPFPS